MNLEQRVEKLERENRRLKSCGVFVVAVLLATTALGAVGSQEIPATIRANSFQLVDGSGKTRGYWGERKSASGAATGIPTFALLGEDGSKLAEFGAEGLFIFGEKSSGVLRATDLFFEDDNGSKRVAIGQVQLLTPATDASTTYPAAVALFDAEGRVIWMAPR